MSKFVVVCASLLLALTSCKKPLPAVSPEAGLSAAVVPDVPLPLALRIPKDVEACFCSANFKTHVEALRATRVWSVVAAYLDEKLPRGTTWADWGKDMGIGDVSLAAGQGSAEALSGLRQISDWYNEMRYRALSTAMIPGTASGAMDHATLDQLILTLERWEMPPLMLTLRGPGSHEALTEVADWLESFPKFAETSSSSITTTQGDQIGVTMAEGGMFLTPALRGEWLEALMERVPGANEVVRATLAHALDVVAGKTFVVALGRGKDTAFVGVARQKDQIRLAAVPEESVLARPELQFVEGHAGKPLLGLFFCLPTLLEALHDKEPTRAMRQGALSAMGAVPVLQEVVHHMARQAADVTKAEQAWTQRDFRPLAAVAWWESGLQLEVRGGVGGKDLEALRQPSRFHSLADEASVVLAVCGNGAGDGRARTVLEAWAMLLHGAALGAADAGLFGQRETLLWPKFLELTMPSFLEAYDASWTMWEKGLGRDGAFVLDTGGRMPPLPGLPENGDKVPLPRIASIQAVVNRELVAASWGRVESGVSQILRVLTPSSPVPLPAAESVRLKEFTSWFYPTPFGSEDLMPSATISDEVLIWGSSRAQQQDLATRISGGKATGQRIRVDFGRLRDFLRLFAEARSDQAARDVVPWLAPFQVLDWHQWAAGEVAHARLMWQIRDLPSYD